MTCSQVWERLASSEDAPIPTSPKPTVASVSPQASILPTHISFSYDPSDDEDGDGEVENLISNSKEHFQYVPLSSQSKLVQFQFLTFARQQQSLLNGDLDQTAEKDNTDSDDDDDDEAIADQHMDDDDQDEEEQQQGEVIELYSVSTADREKSTVFLISESSV